MHQHAGPYNGYSGYYPRCMREAPELCQDTSAAPAIRPNYALLIIPFYPKAPHASFGKHVLTPSLSLTSIAAATPPEWQVACWDENLLQGPPPSDPFPHVVGITVHLTFARRAYELARWYRERGAKVILGGLHVMSCPDEAAVHGDALVLGEGVQLWPEILHDVSQGKLRSRYSGSYRKPYGEEPAPRRELLARESFLTTASLIATRGCHNRCGYCYLATNEMHMPYQVKAPEMIAAEFEQSAEPYAVFTDNNLGSKPAYLRSLCRVLKPLERIWSAAVTIDITDDPSLVREMALAGCTGVFVGFETLNAANLEEAGKRTCCPEDYARRVRIFHDNGIQVNASFVFGFDHDTPSVFEETTQWVEDNRLECATFHLLTPYPGTPLFRQLDKEGRLLHKNWDLYDTAHVVFRPRLMTPEQLQQGYVSCYRRLFSNASIWMRRPERWGEIPGYLAMSYLYKKANWLWPFLIRHRLTHRAWSPLVELSRRRHVRFRKVLERSPGVKQPAAPAPIWG